MSTEAKETELTSSPSDRAKKWNAEFKASRDALKEWHEDAAKAVKRSVGKADNGKRQRLPLFEANCETLEALLVGKTPNVDVSRRYGDMADDVARVAGEAMERCLNLDIEKDSDTFAKALRLSVKNWRRAGMGSVRLKYDVEFETTEPVEAQMDVDPMTGQSRELAPAVPAQEVKSYECVETQWVHWRDMLWSVCRAWHENRWVAFLAKMPAAEFEKRFGKEIAAAAPVDGQKDKGEEERRQPWARYAVWECWDKEGKRIDWYVEGYPSILDTKEDTLGLDNFWPCPEPLFTNLDNESLCPTTDYSIAEKLYDEAETVADRLARLVKAARVRGVYDKTMDAVSRILKEGDENDMLAADNWAALSERGGLKGVVDWFPLEMVVQAIAALTERLSEVMQLLYQVTGMSDIMRGQASTQTTATEQAIKARFASVRVQAMQDEVARFAGDAQRIKAEIISKHFDPATIARNSNVEQTQDKDLAGPAIQLLKSDLARYRIEVKPENVSLTDFTALKQERTEIMQAVGSFMQSVAPIAQAMPGSTAFLLELLQWTISGLKGASTVEGIFDKAIAQAQQQAQQAAMQPPQPDPQAEALKMRAGVDMQKAQMDLVSTKAKTDAHLMKTAADIQRMHAQTAANNAFNGPGGAANENGERNAGVAAVNALVGGEQ